VQRARQRHRRRARRLDPARLISLDEMGAKTNMTRLYGWGRREQRLIEAVPAGHWETTTLIQAVDLNGVRAAMLTDGPTNATVFSGFVEWLLAPVLQPNDIVLLDNLSSHKSTRVLRVIEEAGAEAWFLPPYSPDLNPIEKLFSKVKHWLRRAKARTEKALYDAVGDALRALTPKDCRNCFRHCGYRVT